MGKGKDLQPRTRRKQTDVEKAAKAGRKAAAAQKAEADARRAFMAAMAGSSSSADAARPPADPDGGQQDGAHVCAEDSSDAAAAEVNTSRADAQAHARRPEVCIRTVVCSCLALHRTTIRTNDILSSLYQPDLPP